MQDSQVNEMKEQVTLLTSQNEKLQNTITQQFSQIQQHKDQYNILKLKLGTEKISDIYISSLCNVLEEITVTIGLLFLHVLKVKITSRQVIRQRQHM